MAELARTDDLLEKQLEKLFSDTVLSPPIREHGRPARSVVSIPQPAGRERLHKPKWLTNSMWIVGILASLAVLVITAVSLKELKSQFLSANAVSRFPSPQPTEQVRRGAGSMANGSPQTSTSPRLSATSTMRSPVVTILPVARQSMQSTLTSTPSPSPTLSSRHELAGTAESTSSGGTERNSDSFRALTPYLGANAIEVTEIPIPTSSSVTPTTATAPEAEPDTDFEPHATPTTTSGATPMPTYEPGPTATIITQLAQPTATFAPTTMPPPAAVTPSSPIRILIPTINLEAPIITVGFENYAIDGQPVTTWAVPAYFAVGWHHTSALPGQAGNTVLNGHQNIYGGVFRNLGALQRNDEIIVFTDSAIYHYQVVEQHILKEEGQPLQVRAANARWIMPTPDERLTLVTCAPSNDNSDRLIVVALPVQPSSPMETPFIQ
jgi:sortase A